MLRKVGTGGSEARLQDVKHDFQNWARAEHTAVAAKRLQWVECEVLKLEKVCQMPKIGTNQLVGYSSRKSSL